MTLDAVIRNGTVTTSTWSALTDVGISGGRITLIGRELPPATEEIDASGMLVLPGGVDIHTHLVSSARRKRTDGFETGTRAAVVGGITTVCDFAFQEDDEGLRPAIARARAQARSSLIDYSLHVVLADPSPLALGEMAEVASEGFGFKIFMVVEAFARRRVDYLSAMRIAAAAGALVAVHAEDHAILTFLTDELLASGRRGVEWSGRSRPAVAEALAVREAIAYAEVTGAAVYLMHLSSAAALDALAEGRRRGLSVYGETRPLYLHLTEEALRGPKGARFVGNPPLRTEADRTALWDGLRSGLLSTVCSDHAPHSLAAKLDPSHSFATIPPGVSNLETQLAMLYSEGVRTRRLTLARLVDLVSSTPARLAGLYPAKGEIAVGSDADLVIFDPERTRTIRGDEMRSASDYDPFEGWSVTGWPILTMSRGEVVYARGEITGAPGRGRFLPRRAFLST